MNTHTFHQKTAAFLVSSAMLMFLGAVPSLVSTKADAASNKSRVSVHDPSVIKLADGSYYIIGSHLAAARKIGHGRQTQITARKTPRFSGIFTRILRNLPDGPAPVKIMTFPATCGHPILSGIPICRSIVCTSA